MLPTISWNASSPRGFGPEPTGLKRDAVTLEADLEGFLESIGSYTPFDFVGDKLKSESTDKSSVWDILYETYDVETSTSNYMDYALMRRDRRDVQEFL